LNRLLADAEFFSSRISKIEGSDNLGEDIVQGVKDKTVVNTVPPPVPASLRPSSDVPAAAASQMTDVKTPTANGVTSHNDVQSDALEETKP
jgi:hypothetical protein